MWETPIPKPGPGEILIKNHYSVVSTGTETATIESANKSVTDKLQNPFLFFSVCILVRILSCCSILNSGTSKSHISFPK